MLGAVPARRKVVTAEIAAVNAVMAGCKPEYFNIVLTALEAVLDPAFNVNTAATSTGGAAICVIVSGPGAAAIGMNARHNVLGSGNRANATIGRAVRLTVANALGAKTGQLDASSVGHPGKYTLCFAENPPAPPWPSLAVEKGYGPDDTTVTIMAVEGPRQIANQLNETSRGRAGVLRRGDADALDVHRRQGRPVRRAARPRARPRRAPGRAGPSSRHASSSPNTAG